MPLPLSPVVTPGEPAGVGPDLVLMVSALKPVDMVVVADADLLKERAELLGLDVRMNHVDLDEPLPKPVRGCINLLHVPLVERAIPGRVSTANATYVLNTLDVATRLCVAHKASALVTGPVHKEVINAAGIAFSGHTEWLAQATGVPRVVMLFVVDRMKVALVTTHLPLASVPGAINREDLLQVFGIIHHDLAKWFGLRTPRMSICGLNPHAGEGGYLGREEIEIIEPAIADARRAGLAVTGPLPADTAFNEEVMDRSDVVVAMYHDQGLPVVKHRGFHEAVNVTLGLPIIRTSVDHGTALDLAGTGKAHTGSFETALKLAAEMAVALPGGLKEDPGTR